MTPQKLVTVLGIPVTTFLVVGAVTIEVVTALTGADVGPGIVGVLFGAAFAVGAFLLAGWRWRDLSPTVRDLLLGYATFGLAFLVLSALSYGNVPGARQYLTVAVSAGVALAVAVVVAGVALWPEDEPNAL